jgi:DNA-binding MarR family transcriptional regulator
MMQDESYEELLRLYVKLLPRVDKLAYPDLPEIQKKYNLNKTQLKTVLLTGLFNGSVMKELWEILNVTKGNLSILIDSLVNKGFVTCERQTDDRRKVRVYLTEEGKSLYEEVYGETRNHIEEQNSGLSKRDRDNLFKLLQILL